LLKFAFLGPEVSSTKFSAFSKPKNFLREVKFGKKLFLPYFRFYGKFKGSLEPFWRTDLAVFNSEYQILDFF